MRSVRTWAVMASMAAGLAMGCVEGQPYDRPTSRTEPERMKEPTTFREIAPLVRGMGAAQRLTYLQSRSKTKRLGDVVNETLPEPVKLEGVAAVVGLNGRGTKEVPAGLTKDLLKSLAKEYEEPREAHEALLSIDSAPVSVTAEMQPFAQTGDRLDLRVQAYAGGVNLEGGLMTESALEELLRLPGGGTGVTGGWTRPDGRVSRGVMALGRGIVSLTPGVVNGKATGPTTATVGYIPAGGIVDKTRGLILSLRKPNTYDALLTEEVLNRRFGKVAQARSEATLELLMPADYIGNWQRYLWVVYEMDLSGGADSVAARARGLVGGLGASNMQASQRAEYALEGLGNPAVGVMREALPRSSGQSRRALLRVLSYLGEPEVMGELVTQSRSGNEVEREEAAMLMGRFNRPESEEALLTLLTDGSGAARSQAIASLEKIQSERSQTVLQRYPSVQKSFVMDSVAAPGPAMVVVYAGVGVRKIQVFGKDVKLVDGTRLSAGPVEVQVTGERMNVVFKNRPDLRPASLPQSDVRSLVYVLDQSGISIQDILLLMGQMDQKRSLTAKVEWLQ